MSHAFRAQRGGRVTGRLEPYEVAVLRGLVEDVVGLVRTEPAGNAAYARLFPDPSHDAAAARELHDLIHDDLREAKLAAARALLESLPDDGKVALDGDAAEAWLTALNDVRLALGTSIGVTEETYDAEPANPSLHVYQWLSFLQESLVEAVSGEGVSERGVER
jgi:hypothetical protein